MQKCFTVWQRIMQVLFPFPPERKAWLHFLAFFSVRCCQRCGPADMSRRYVWSLKVALTKKWAFTMISFYFSQLQGKFSEDSEQNSATRWEEWASWMTLSEAQWPGTCSCIGTWSIREHYIKPLRLWVFVSIDIFTFYLN